MVFNSYIFILFMVIVFSVFFILKDKKIRGQSLKKIWLFKVENKKTNEQLMQTIKNTVFVEDEVPCKEFKKEMENFIKYCNEHNIKIYATWPAYLYDKKEFSNPDLEKINNIEEYYNSKNIKVLGNYTDSIYDINLFYDSYYHLNEEGKSIRTKYLINLIKEEILK